MSMFARPLVLYGPSGTGKSTLIKRLFAENPDKFGYSVSHTTRAPRAGEENGTAYHFVTRETFLSLVSDGAFVEHAEFAGNLYGTSIAAVRTVAESGRRCILDIDSQGVRAVKKTDLNAVFVFIAPPSLTELKARLVGRGSDAPESVEKRMATAIKELAYARTPEAHDYVVVNDDINRAFERVKRIAFAEADAQSDSLPDY